MNKVEQLLTRGVANIIPSKNVLAGKLMAGKKLNVYLGIDPTATKIHLGHALVLRKLNQFALLGHNVTFLIGDFTALIGDTSDKDSERPSLTSKEIEENFKTYKKQAEKILDFSKVKIKYNSEWLKKLDFEDFLKLMHHFSAGDFVGRELIKKRLSENKRVGLHELLYPVMQGYDSYFLDTDVQIGGADQVFNMQAGRTLNKDLRNKESFIVCTNYLMGTDGRKMSKSWGNAIWLDDNATDMYAKVMAINDNLIIQYFTLATNLPISEILKFEKKLKQKENPINIKKELANQIVKELHDARSAEKAQENFEKTVQNNEVPDDIPKLTFYGEFRVIEALMARGIKSRSEGKRLIDQRGIKLDDKLLVNPNIIPPRGEHELQIGQKRLYKLNIKK